MNLQLYTTFSEFFKTADKQKQDFPPEFDRMTMTYFEQKLCDLKVAVGTSVMERNEAAAESEIRITGQIQEPGFLCRRCVSPFVLGVDISPVLEEQLNDADSVVARSQVQRRGLEERRGG